MAASQNTGTVSDSSVDDVDRQLMSWKLHLPGSKQEVLRVDGEVDEVLILAQMCSNMRVSQTVSPVSRKTWHKR